MNVLRKELEDFLTVARFMNLSKSADYLGVKQSGLSKSIMRLENELGQKLFIRSSRKLVLTDAGQVYLNRIQDMQGIWDIATNEVSSLFDEVSGNFKLGCHAILSKSILPELITKTTKRPSIKLDFFFENSRECLKRVLNSELDFAIVADPIEYPELVIKKLWREFIGLYSIDGEEKSTILFNENMINAYKALKNYPNSEHQAINDYDVLHSIVKRCDFMGLLPNPIADKGGVLQLIKKFHPPIDVCLIFRADRLKTKGFTYLIHEMTTCLS